MANVNLNRLIHTLQRQTSRQIESEEDAFEKEQRREAAYYLAKMDRLTT